MDTREAIARRIRELCRQRGITPVSYTHLTLPTKLEV